MVKVLKAYSYLYEIVKAIDEGRPLPMDELVLFGGRQSGKSFSVEDIIVMIMSLVKRKTAIYGFRNQITNAEEYFNEFLNVFEINGINPQINKSNFSVKCGSSKLRVIGLNSNSKATAKKSGLSNAGQVEYIIRIFEEAFEFQERDVLAIKEAVRGIGNNIKVLDIYVCNPWSKSSWIVKYANSLMPFDMNKLKTDGQQFGCRVIDLGEGYQKRVVLQYTNWRVNTTLSQSVIENIKNTWLQDKRRAMTTDYGMPGYEDGSIYSHLLTYLGESVYQEHDFILGGLDYGWGNQKTSSKTVCYFMGASVDKGVDVYGEYVSDNRQMVKNTEKVADDIIRFYHDQMRVYCNKIHVSQPFPIRVRVDYANEPLIVLLNRKAKDYRIDHWLTFTKCSKEIKTEQRIDYTIALMSKQLLRVSDSVAELKANMEAARYDDTEVRKRIKQDDDGLNAFEYGMEKVFRKIVKYNEFDSNINIGKVFY